MTDTTSNVAKILNGYKAQFVEFDPAVSLLKKLYDNQDSKEAQDAFFAALWQTFFQETLEERRYNVHAVIICAVTRFGPTLQLPEQAFSRLTSSTAGNWEQCIGYPLGFWIFQHGRNFEDVTLDLIEAQCDLALTVVGEVAVSGTRLSGVLSYIRKSVAGVRFNTFQKELRLDPPKFAPPGCEPNQESPSSRERRETDLDEPEGVFISYRESPLGKAAAQRVNSYLQQHGLLTWFFPEKVGWGDNQYKSIAAAIGAARAAVIVFTPDFPSGPSAEQEYYSLLAKRTQEPAFKTGLLLVGANQSDVPPLMTHYFSVSVKDATDIDFEVQVHKIYRGLLGLPLEGEE